MKHICTSLVCTVYERWILTKHKCSASPTDITLMNPFHINELQDTLCTVGIPFFFSFLRWNTYAMPSCEMIVPISTRYQMFLFTDHHKAFSSIPRRFHLKWIQFTTMNCTAYNAVDNWFRFKSGLHIFFFFFSF